MLARLRDSVQCEWFKNPDREWLAEAWQTLERQSDTNFFLSWLWIGTWLDSFVTDFNVLEARRDGETVGLGIIVSVSPSFNSGSLRCRHYLHRTGVGEEDQIWIEYNDFLVSTEGNESIRRAMFSYISNKMGKTDAFIVGACRPEIFSSVDELGMSERKIWETNSYFLDLDPFCCGEQSLLHAISRNSRYQITRSMRRYSDIGDITVETAQTQKKAIDLLELAGPYHLARWGDGSSGSGLTNRKFVDFHHMLIARGLDQGCIELNHVKAGDETIGIVYNFKYRNVVYFYFCSMNYQRSSCSHYKPGLVSHYLLIEKAIRDGAAIYDFMGGSARYKNTFANQTGKLVVLQYEHKGILLACEDYARVIKHKLIPVKEKHRA